MPNRILKESICSSDDIEKLKPFEEVFFYRLIVKCDDFGRYDARPKVLKSALFPIKDGITAKNVEDALHTLASLGLVKLYEVEGRPFLFLPTWSKHQTKRAKTSKWPEPISSEIICKQMQADVHVFEKRETRNDIRETRNDIRETRNENVRPRKRDIFEGRSFSQPVMDMVNNWLKYKSERREGYKPTGLNSLLSQIENVLKELSEAQVIYAISESMACNYQGIIWDKAKQKQLPPTHKTPKDAGMDTARALVEKLRKGEMP